MENGKEPINPHLVYTHSGEVQEYSMGLTKREYFAGLAMQGILASNTEGLARGMIDVTGLIQSAVRSADELLKELEKTKSK